MAKKGIAVLLPVLLSLGATGASALEKDELYWSGHSAGFLGAVALGIGTKWYKGKLESELLYGYAPDSLAGKEVSVAALKTRRLLKTRSLFGKSVTPYWGLGIHYYFGSEYKVDGPYPHDYYPYTPWHAVPYLGVKLQPFETQPASSINFEVGTIDEYLIHYTNNVGQLGLDEVLSVSIGLSIPLK